MEVNEGQSKCNKDEKKMPPWIIVAPIIYAIILIITALAIRNVVNIDIIGLKLPALLPWFGMLGGTVASLTGIFYHNEDWNNSFVYWHFFSGLIGAAFGIFGYLVVVAGVDASGSTFSPTTSNAPAFSALVAFVLGYGQTHVHAMVDQLFAAIFQKPKSLGSVSKPGDATEAVQVKEELAVTNESKNSN